MRSIKPGRGPSFMGGLVSIFAGLFGVFWIVAVAGSGGGFFALFGVIFVIIAIFNAVYNFKNATGENRYSTYDIVDSTEETDPLNDRYGKVNNTPKPETVNPPADNDETRFCPWCGAKAEEGYSFCKSCGKKLP